MKASKQIIGLDVVRIAAALMVSLFHLGYWHWTKGGDPRATMPMAYAPFAPILSAGWVGVEIFFVLSGFVISYSAESITFGRFLQHRFYRLYPTALVCATLTSAVLLTAYSPGQVAGPWLRSATLFPVGPWVDGTYWTLPIEVAFYLVVGFGLLSKRASILPALLAVLGVSSALVCVLLQVPGFTHALPFSPGLLDYPPLACLLLIHGCFFALGGYLYLYLLRGASVGRGLMLVIAGAGCVSELLLHSRTIGESDGQHRSASFPLLVWGVAVVSLALAVRLNTRIGALVGTRAAAYVRRAGVATYPMYLLHSKVGHVLIAGTRRKIGYLAALGLALTLVAGLSWLVSEVLEPRVGSLLRRPSRASALTK